MVGRYARNGSQLVRKLRHLRATISAVDLATGFAALIICAALATIVFRARMQSFTGRRRVTGSTCASITTAFPAALSTVAFVTITAAVSIAIAVSVVAPATADTAKWQPSITRRLHLLLAGCSFASTPEFAAAAGLAAA